MKRDLLELAAGCIVTGFSATSLDAQTRAALERVPFAGYILFTRNIESLAQLRELTDGLRAVAGPAPIVSIDQEGGRVFRLRVDVEPIPPMMALGATRDAQLARACGQALAHDLRRAGCNLDFAPVLDLAVDPRNTVIGTRAFGADPHLVTELGGAFARGMHDAGIVPVYKHFPGHGATAFDTHLGPARLDADIETLQRRDFVPFERLAPHASALMAAHVAVPAIDGDVPASMSRRMLTGWLRETWHYRGVCFTDCMQMDAIAAGVGTVQGVSLAIAAGADCALVSHDPQLAYDAACHLAASVERGEIERERLEEAHARVSALRASLQPPVALDAPSPHPGIGRTAARRAVTLVRGSVPVAGEARVVFVHRAHLHPTERDAAERALNEDPETVVVSTGEPFDLDCFPQARTLLACYGDDELSLEAVNDVLRGEAAGSGRLPV